MTARYMRQVAVCEHDEKWAPAGHAAAAREVVATEVVDGMVVRQNRPTWSETRLIVVNGKVVRNGYLMENMTDDLRIPTWLRRRIMKARKLYVQAVGRGTRPQQKGNTQ